MTVLATEIAHGERGGAPVAGIATFVAAVIRRRRFNRMLELEDHLLEDIGVLRAEVLNASRLPITVNAAIELRRMAHQRRAWERGFTGGARN